MEESFIKTATGASSADLCETIQPLWSGYGSIVRYSLSPPSLSPSTVILKHVLPPKSPTATPSASHARKLRSYAVETAFYTSYASRTSAAAARVPRLLAVSPSDGSGERLILMEDLDAAGFSERRFSGTIREDEVLACALWLARFHATFLTRGPFKSQELWEVGCYWDLSTRAEELAEMAPGRLQDFAAPISDRLRSARWQTLVHGDAKLANFCFREAEAPIALSDVAAVDFQYAGGGPGVRDVVYLVISAFGGRDLAVCGARVYEGYFAELRVAAVEMGFSVAEAEEVAAEWQGLVSWAVADFSRFISGWTAGHWDVYDHVHSETERVLCECEAESEKK